MSGTVLASNCLFRGVLWWLVDGDSVRFETFCFCTIRKGEKGGIIWKLNKSELHRVQSLYPALCFRVARLVATSRRLVDESHWQGRLSLAIRLMVWVERLERLVTTSHDSSCFLGRTTQFFFSNLACWKPRSKQFPLPPDPTLSLATATAHGCWLAAPPLLPWLLLHICSVPPLVAAAGGLLLPSFHGCCCCWSAPPLSYQAEALEV